VFKVSEIIKTRNLMKIYGEQKSVDHLNITVNQGEIYGFLGRNGAGKTTTIRMLLGLIKPTFGQVEIFGENLFNNQKSILRDRKSTRLNSSHVSISYAVFCLKKKKKLPIV